MALGAVSLVGSSPPDRAVDPCTFSFIRYMYLTHICILLSVLRSSGAFIPW